MLEIRPSCEHCNLSLPPNSGQAMVCSYECTFCKKCVDEVLQNICPNCGGGFCLRPVRPANNLNGNNFLGEHPATEQITYKPVNLQKHKALVAKVGSLKPDQR